MGCSVTHGGPTSSSDEAHASPTLDKERGLVTIPQASLQYLSVAPVASEGENLVVHVPARVAFKDGAISQIGAPMAGRVTAIAVRSGERVRAGAMLVTLTCPDAATARGTLESARAALREARAALDRETRMLAEGVGVERDRLAAEVHLATAQAEVDRAEATSAFVGQGKGADLIVRAPIGGTVLSLKTSVGAAVEPGGEPLIEIGDPSALWIVAEVTERELPLIHEGASASVELSSVPRPMTAQVTSVGAAVSNGLRTAPVWMAPEGETSDLRPGMFGRVRIQAAPAGVTLPTEAVLIKDGKESVVYVEKRDLTFERRSVVVGQPIEGRVQVVSGLSPGERVVVRGALLLDGAAEQLL